HADSTATWFKPDGSPGFAINVHVIAPLNWFWKLANIFWLNCLLQYLAKNRLIIAAFTELELKASLNISLRVVCG
ncbi:MAG: hypothetical protein AB8B38_09125, partial [Prochlorococcus sp.]